VVFETQRLEGSEPPKPQGSSGGYDENILPRAVLQNVTKLLKSWRQVWALFIWLGFALYRHYKKCALKEMISTTPDPHIRCLIAESFSREANLLVQLNHPGIPKIYDFSVRPCAATGNGAVEGEDLENVLENTEGILKGWF
jgi:serine/threonine protein kinase